MAFGNTPAGRRARRWRPAALLALLLTLSALGAGAWRHFFGPLSPEELALVGDWVDRDDARPGVRYIKVYRPDRTVVTYYRDIAGALVATTTSGPWRWRLSGGRLDTWPDGTGDRVRDAIYILRHGRDGVLELTPDGPDRFRYTLTGDQGGPPATGTLTRLKPAPGDSP